MKTKILLNIALLIFCNMIPPVLSQAVRNVKGYCRNSTTAGGWEGRCIIKTRFEGQWMIVQIDENMVLTKPKYGESPNRSYSEVSTFRLTKSSNCRAWAGTDYFRSSADPGCYLQHFDPSNGGWSDGGCLVENKGKFTMWCGSSTFLEFQTTLPRPTE